MIPDQDINLFARKVALRLQAIYPESFSESYVNRIIRMVSPKSSSGSLWNEKDVVLVTYGNSIIAPGERPLITLRRFLGRLKDCISCIHILPFFPSTSDDGFAVSDYEHVDDRLGDWDDIAGIGSDFSLMFDLIINHVSASHPWFINFLREKNPGKDFFIELDSPEYYQHVIRPRSTPLFTTFMTSGGIKKIWTTFSADQIDLNFNNPEVLLRMIHIMLYYISLGARIIRLDAVAFLCKEGNTTCLHLGKTHEVIKLLRDIVSYADRQVIIITETNVPNHENWSYFGKDDEAHMVYQFTLPPLILYSLFTGDAQYLTSWAESIPPTGVTRSFLNFTASHDGIGIRPLEGILPENEIQLLIAGIRKSGGLVSEKSNHDGTFSPYELNITYMDALKNIRNGPDEFREKRFLCSQLIMLAMQGIPAIYIHSLLGTENDYEGVKKSGQARSINRRSWNEKDILRLLSVESVNKRIFNEYIRVLSIRREITAFHPDCPQHILRYGNSFFSLIRENQEKGEKIFCLSNITDQNVSLPRGKVPDGMIDLLSGDNNSFVGNIPFGPYQTRWLR